MRQQPRPGAAARDRMRRRRRLGDLLAAPARELLAHVLDHLPLARHQLQRLGHVLAQLAQRAAAARAGRSAPDRPRARAADVREGGRHSAGPRDNQFAFVAMGGDGGWKGGARYWQPCQFRRSWRFYHDRTGKDLDQAGTALDRWFQLTEADTFEITGVYRVQLLSTVPNDDHRISHFTIWDEFFTGECHVKIQNRMSLKNRQRFPSNPFWSNSCHSRSLTQLPASLWRSRRHAAFPGVAADSSTSAARERFAFSRHRQ